MRTPVPTTVQSIDPETFTYWAFISYSHRDRKWGDWLHRALETYRVPKRFVGKVTRDGVLPRRLFPIFRDREELRVSSDLGNEINQALIESRYLIIVCSPNSAKSVWVDEEIKFFKKLGREDRVLALIVAGEPNASDGKPGFTTEDECFPEALRYQVGSDGRVLSVRTEPVAGDVRQGKDGKTNAKLKLLAGLLDVNFDALRQREQERRRRSLLQVTGAALLISVAMSLVAVYAVLQAREAKKQTKAAEYARDQADGLINFMLYDLRDRLQPIGRLDVLDDVAKKAKEYLDRLPKELVTASRLEQQAVLRNNLGDVLVLQGKLAEALGVYQQGLALAKRLAEQDKTNSGWQRDLLRSYWRVGDVLQTQGKLPEALNVYQQVMAIAKSLAEQDKTNTEWQRDLSLSYNGVGSVLQTQGKLPEALDAYQQGLALAKRLAEQDKSNSGWQRDLSVSLNRIGEVLAAQGRLAEALDAYQQGLKIRQSLADQDKTNSGWQRDLVVSYNNVGDVLAAQGDLIGALNGYRDAFAISEMLAKRDPSNVDWQNDAAWSRYCIAKVLTRSKNGDRNEAKRLVAEGVEIITRLEHQGALNRYTQDTLNKLSEISNVLNSSSSE
jgi:eukaryotic-like serine/threonine-protein kinase